MDELSQFFAALCGQAAAHTWAPGGVLLPVCQRCTGLYTGAAVAVLLHFWFRPRLTGRFLEIHGAFLLLMVPFGYHWVPQGPALRAATGVFFGFGVVTFLLLPQADVRGLLGRHSRDAHEAAGGSGRYFAGVLAALLLVPLLGARGGVGAGWGLALTACSGALVLAALVAVNVGVGLNAAIRILRRRANRKADA